MNAKITFTAKLLLIASAILLGVAQAETNRRVGYAYDKQTGRLLYTETHHEVKRDGRVVKSRVAYQDGDGNVFAEKHVDFGRSATMPDFHLVNVDNGHVEGARIGNESLRVHFRRESGAEVKEAAVSAGPAMASSTPVSTSSSMRTGTPWFRGSPSTASS